jgi:glycosyltransferase involved in cell wall biosynthesis
MFARGFLGLRLRQAMSTLMMIHNTASHCRSLQNHMSIDEFARPPQVHSSHPQGDSRSFRDARHRERLDKSLIQLVREWPPGYGGVERVAHEWAAAIHAADARRMRTVSLSGPAADVEVDPLPVSYPRERLPSMALGQLVLPLPGRRLARILLGPQTLHIHLPCPGLLLIGMLARVLRPRRRIRIHWHALLEPDPGAKGLLVSIYQWLALRWAAVAVDQVVTTSPVLADALSAEGIPEARLVVLPCFLPAATERAVESRREPRQAWMDGTRPFRILFVGRLDSYKRVDWLIAALPSGGGTELHIVGDGPRRAALAAQAAGSPTAACITFHGRLDETAKTDLIVTSDLLVLPADRSNEAFGIVQLEAMVFGVPALALEQPCSGTAWVNGLAGVLARYGVAPVRDVRGLAEAIRVLRDRPGCWSEAARAARSRYEAVFARSILVPQVLDLAR